MDNLFLLIGVLAIVCLGLVGALLETISNRKRKMTVYADYKSFTPHANRLHSESLEDAVQRIADARQELDNAVRDYERLRQDMALESYLAAQDLATLANTPTDSADTEDGV